MANSDMRINLPAATERLILRPFESKDAPTFSAYRSDPEIARYQGWQAPYSLEQARDFIAEMQAKIPGQPGQWYQVALELKEDRRLIGDCAFRLSEDGRQAELCLKQARANKKRGYAREAGDWLLAALFGTLKVQRVFANIDPRNTAAIQSIGRLGFRFEGRFKQSLWLKGEWVDEEWYALLREEWIKPSGRAA